MLGVLFAASTALPLASQSGDAKADAILANARRFVGSRSFPAKLTYRVAISMLSETEPVKTRTYQSEYDGLRRRILVHSISEEESQAPPVTPHGSDFKIGLTASTATGSTGPSEEPVANETCEHLRLEPARRSDKLRLRELWVAPDGAPLRAVVHGNFLTKPWDAIDWTIEFHRDGSALYLSSETSTQILRFGKTLRGRVSVTFLDIAAPFGYESFPLEIRPANAVREP